MGNNENNLTIDEFLAELHCQREIEFVHMGQSFFAEPCTEPPQVTCYHVWDVDNHKLIFTGTPEQLVNFMFPNGLSMQSCFEAFEILYIL